jgi:hypothetical protein
VIFPCPETTLPVEYTFVVSRLPTMITAVHLLSIFSPFGQIYELAIHTTPSFDASQLLCIGTAIVRMYGPVHLRDHALVSLNGAFVFPYHPPIMVSLHT